MKGQIEVKRKGKPSLGPEIFRESKYTKKPKTFVCVCLGISLIYKTRK